MLEVKGTTVMTPYPTRTATELALSLLIITAGRRLLASAPSAGSRSTMRISPRLISRFRRHLSFPSSPPGRCCAILERRPHRPPRAQPPVATGRRHEGPQSVIEIHALRRTYREIRRHPWAG